MNFDAIIVTLNPAIDHFVVIPEFKTGRVNRVTEVLSKPGGKGINVASTLADHKLKIAATGFLGCENTALFEELFHQKDIADYFIRIPGQTRSGIKINDPLGNETTDLNFPGQVVSAEDLNTFHQIIGELAAPWFILAGSLPPGVPDTIYRDLIVTLQASGHQVVLDTSGQALRHAIAACPTVIKPNIHELEDFLGRPLPTEKEILNAVHALLATGIKLVVVSMGEKGAYLVSETEAIFAAPPQVLVHTTVGAGDAMVAGIVVGNLRKLPLTEIAQLATACSVHAISGIAISEAIPQVKLRNCFDERC